MTVTWIAIQCQPYPWDERRTDLAYVACGERAGELALVRPVRCPQDPGVLRLLASLERAVSVEKSAPNLDWLRRAIPDQGTSIRLSPIRRCQAESYQAQVDRLASQTGDEIRFPFPAPR